MLNTGLEEKNYKNLVELSDCLKKKAEQYKDLTMEGSDQSLHESISKKISNIRLTLTNFQFLGLALEKERLLKQQSEIEQDKQREIEYKTAQHTIGYLLNKFPNKTCDKTTFMNTLWLCERAFICKWGNVLFDKSYNVTEEGFSSPVAERCLKDSDLFTETTYGDPMFIGEVDKDYISKAGMEVLDTVYNATNNLTSKEINRIATLSPEYKKAYIKSLNNIPVSMMCCHYDSKSGSDSLDTLFSLSKEEAESMRLYLIENLG